MVVYRLIMRPLSWRTMPAPLLLYASRNPHFVTFGGQLIWHSSAVRRLDTCNLVRLINNIYDTVILVKLPIIFFSSLAGTTAPILASLFQAKNKNCVSVSCGCYGHYCGIVNEVDRSIGRFKWLVPNTHFLNTTASEVTVETTKPV